MLRLFPITKTRRFNKSFTMIILLSILLLLTIASFAYLAHPKFGKAPSGARLERIKRSPNFRDGKFQNESFTPMVTEGQSMVRVTFDYLFKTFPRTIPKDPIPSIKNDLKAIPLSENVLVWFGHSSYYIQLHGIRFLVDPVFSSNASPIPRSNKSFKGSDTYSADDLPEIDFLLISHDHYDHLDYETIIQLRPKVHQVVCGLGVGAHFEHWNYDPSIILEKDWHENIAINDTLSLFTAPARHFSGRGFKRNNTLWLSFVLQSPIFTLYLGGDSGYDQHFKALGEKFGAFDLALLDNGQYHKAWQNIHLLPEETLMAARDLNAKRLFPVHNSKFKLGFHPWDEPLNEISAHNASTAPISLVTPKIGEIVFLNDLEKIFEEWWRGVE